MQRHSLDILSLIFGLIFLVAVGLWLVTGLVDITLPSAGWLFAGALIVSGLVGVVVSLRPRAH